MRSNSRNLRTRAKVALFGTGVVLFHTIPLGGCDLGTITTTSTTTLDGRQVIADLIRSAILTPLDAAITHAIEDLVGFDDDDE